MTKILTTLVTLQNIPLYKEAGSDGILVGDNFHAARNATPFSLSEMEEASKKAKENHLLFYVSMNRNYFDEDKEKVKEYLTFLKTIHIDGIYYNDPLVYRMCEKEDMVKYLIYNPDTLMCNSSDIDFALSQGIQEVVISPEITLEEMKHIAEKEKKVQVTIHGYLNMSYSRRHLIQNYLEEIKKEIDLDARRDLVLIESTRQGKMPIIEDNHGTHIFTDYVQESFDEVKTLEESGVESFIVDGIFMKEEDVLDAVRSYKEILRGANAKEIKEAYYHDHPSLPLSTGYMYQKTNLVK